VNLSDSFYQPESQSAYSGYEKKPVVTPIESDAYASEAERNPPALDREKALIEIRNYICDLKVFCPKVLMERRRLVILW
jgi:hypothetical protein